MNNDWEIKSRSHSCSQTGKEFAEGELFYTLLFREAEGFRREDLCVEAWEARNENIQPFSFWKSRYEPPPPPKAEALKKDDAEGLLREMISQDLPGTKNARYVLALMLERKKVLRPVESSDPALLVYEHAESGEVFALENPGLKLEQIPEVQKEVAALLDGSALG